MQRSEDKKIGKKTCRNVKDFLPDYWWKISQYDF